MFSIKKMLLNMSLSSMLLSGCISPSVPYASMGQTKENTVSAEKISIDDIDNYYNKLRKTYKPGIEQYRADLLFTKNYAESQNKRFFEFDGTTYPANALCLMQMNALIEARKRGEKTYTFNGREFEACSYYPAAEQMAVFGNLWEELRSPQDEITKGIINDYINILKHLGNLRYGVKDRIYEICRLCDYPEIRDQRKEISMMGRIIKASCGREQTYYSPSAMGRGVIYLAPKRASGKGIIPDYEGIVAELAHAFRTKTNLFGEPVHFITDGLKDLATFNSWGFGRVAHRKNYKNPARMEYDAHKIVEPALNTYVQNPYMSMEALYYTIQQGRINATNTYTLTPSAYRLMNAPTDQIKQYQIPLLGYRRGFNINQP